MFYPELSKIVNDLFSTELIEELDVWFASLPRNHKDKITASKISIKFDIDFNISIILLEECCGVGILKKNYAITCPICEHVLKISSDDKLYEDISNIAFCYNCDESKLGFTSDNILILYSLIKNPTNNPDKVKLLTKKYIEESKKHKGINTSTLTDYLSKSDCNPNSIFYNPNEKETEELATLLSNLTGTFDNTTDKGNALEDLAEFLLNIVKPFKVSRIIRTPTNQLDVVIRNQLPLPGSIFLIMGTHCIAECKNEKEKPDNTYYHKLISILRLASSNFGIVFSFLPAAATCKTIARETYLQDKTIVINIHYEDFKLIIEKNMNFLDIIESKALDIKMNSTKNLYETTLFQESGHVNI
ncbi:hypothetical protein [Tissierella sp.]|uniref:hypothetical protein n=1 Tax=Tissierella sp. TaxID=41274 RepID=UPI00285C0C72|nr:hypothetical protein [Tissierella sp.]MDR7856348.1 hypothetical protein [Tissierella sp.]